MDYTILSNEIRLPQYENMTDSEIADALNALSAATRQRVAVATLQARAYEIGASMALRMAIVAPETPAQLRALCEEVLSLVNSRLDSIDLDNPSAVQMFGALVQAGVLTQAQAAQIDGLATVPGVSRAVALGLGAVAEADVAAARAWHEYDVLLQRVQAGGALALGWLYQQRDAGAAVPEWSAVLERM